MKPRRQTASAAADSPAPASGSFGGLARQMRDWTTNALATAIVLVGGLAVGSQVVVWWFDRPPATIDDPAVQAALRLPEIDGTREFWTRHGSMKVARVEGEAAEALAAMKTLCRAPANVPAKSAAGPGEAQFVARLAAQTPLEEAGNVALYQPANQKSMVVAVDLPSGRIVGWSFALPTEVGTWSIYHFRPQTAVSPDDSAAMTSRLHE
jgi:hypothetical protein